MARRPAIVWTWFACAAACAAMDGAALRAQPAPILPSQRLALPPIPTYEGESEPLPPALPGISTRIALQPGTPGEPLPPPTLITPLAPEVILPDGSSVTLPASTKQVIRFAPRYGKLNDYIVDPIGDDVQRITYTGGLKVNVVMLANVPGQPAQEIEFATDNAVIWVKGAKKGTDILGGIRTERTDPDKPGEQKSDKMTIELYCSGNVVVQTRSADGTGDQTLRAEELYYDLDRSRAVGIGADLEMSSTAGTDPVHLRTPELWRLGPKEWRAFDTLVFSSKRPADPALTIKTREATLTDQTVAQRNIFGQPYRKVGTGEVDTSTRRELLAKKNRFELLGIPFFYWPTYRADISEPAGPLVGLGIRNDTVFGFQVYSTFDMYKLLALRGPPQTSWILHADYLARRGPGIGSDFNYVNLFGGGSASSGNISLGA